MRAAAPRLSPPARTAFFGTPRAQWPDRVVARSTQCPRAAGVELRRRWSRPEGSALDALAAQGRRLGVACLDWWVSAPEELADWYRRRSLSFLRPRGESQRYPRVARLRHAGGGDRRRRDPRAPRQQRWRSTGPGARRRRPCRHSARGARREWDRDACRDDPEPAGRRWHGDAEERGRRSAPRLRNRFVSAPRWSMGAVKILYHTAPVRGTQGHPGGHRGDAARSAGPRSRWGGGARFATSSHASGRRCGDAGRVAAVDTLSTRGTIAAALFRARLQLGRLSRSAGAPSARASDLIYERYAVHRRGRACRPQAGRAGCGRIELAVAAGARAPAGCAAAVAVRERYSFGGAISR